MKINNPILAGFNPDPSICRKGDDFYIAVSTFEWFPGVRIYHSKDLKNWRFISSPLNSLDKLNMIGNADSGGIWAPALSYHDGLFWLLYTDVKAVTVPWKNGKNYLITAEDISGPWSDPIPMDNGGFDPFLFHDEDKKYFVYRAWGPSHHSDPNNRIVLKEYNHETKELSEEFHYLYSGTPFRYTEGPQIIKRNGYYYLITAEGGTSFEHRVTVCRSKSLFGPYEESPSNPLMTAWDDPLNPLQKAGHASFLETQDGEWFVAYLMARPLQIDKPLLAKDGRGFCSLGRETSLDRLEWIDDWPKVSGNNHPKLQIDGPKTLNECTWDEDLNGSFIDYFRSPQLSSHWQTLRIPFNRVGTILDKEGILRLYGKDSLISTFEQSTVGTRWKHHKFQSTVKMTFNPKHFQQSAGISCYYNTTHFSYLNVSRHIDSNQKILSIHEVDNGVFSSYHYLDNFIEIPEEITSIWLRVNIDYLQYWYEYSFDGLNFVENPQRFSSIKISDDYVSGRGFFTGAFVCLHCEDISRGNNYADFMEFNYTAKE
ncbi:beta-xylosidase [Gallibacterium salpingitidis]|uniref:Beta-xylosidase n=1 Tax=Gallibacterium salpingitidis TaxID=505341 RepID=A0AB36E5A9_9PAST|nr:glycoside hydrolase family 43 protein [Gallibacterium salpingitidis]OBX09038.1 beta-xylosidase [Gallibacterium salpingitidis]OBX10158.1 beta-xylosidase [Gallibacterium salpingitidis]